MIRVLSYNPPHMCWSTFPTINTPRLTLRWISSDDVDALFGIFANPEVMRYWSTPPLANREAAVELLHEIHDSFNCQSMLKWGVARQADNVVIGTTTLYNLDFNNRRAEIGYALGREHWGQGYMHEALQGLLDYCFKTLNFRRLEADVDPRNKPSIQTLERLGFQREGFLRQRWEVGGEIQDALFYGLIRSEWKKY
ncbi:MAG TPA: GNAT family N-acetyltransferase [Pyrinomonadaceae bacterium]|nr:GNAT family N-acetyltransferase [Pyrinomonadaceae bacterium]